MQSSRFNQIILSLAILACFVCMTFARPAAVEASSSSSSVDIPAGKIKTPRLKNTILMKRAEPVDSPMLPYDQSHEPTREAALAKNNGSTDYQFNFEYKDTNPLRDGLTKMEELNEKAEKKKKKEDKKAKEEASA